MLFSAVFFLVAIGLSGVYSVDLSRGGDLYYFKKQLIAASVGLVFLVGASFTQYTFFRSNAKLFYFAAVLLLVAVFFFGTNIRGARSWFTFNGFSFQPLEFAKVGIIFMLAYIIYNFGRRFERLLFFLGTAIVTGIIMVLIMMERDIGSASIIGSIWFGLMLLVGVRRLHLGIFLVGVVVFSIFGWFFLLHQYQRDRVLTFVNPERDALVTGYNTTQAIIAVGSGRFLGRGLGFGSQSQLRFLPEAQTDFIFSVIAEELGLVGVVVLIGLFTVMLWRLLRIVRLASDDFIAATVSGITILFFVQFLVNVGANIGLLPITGVTLPFVSYGGSSLIINLFLVGVAQSMIERRY